MDFPQAYPNQATQHNLQISNTLILNCSHISSCSLDLGVLAVHDVLDELHVICPHSHLEAFFVLLSEMEYNDYILRLWFISIYHTSPKLNLYAWNIFLSFELKTYMCFSAKCMYMWSHNVKVGLRKQLVGVLALTIA